jgi:hypothetical protein
MALEDYMPYSSLLEELKS